MTQPAEMPATFARTSSLAAWIATLLVRRPLRARCRPESVDPSRWPKHLLRDIGLRDLPSRNPR
jgi:hypothetical protein